MLQMERSGKPRPVADRYRHGPGVRKSSIGKEVDLHREYHHAVRRQAAVRERSVKFGNGNRYGLIGANGCGKSTS